MTKTNTGLCEYAVSQLGKPYWYGTFGNTASESLYKSKKNQYPSYYLDGKYKTGFKNQYGQRVHDCVGLIKGYLWSERSDSKPVYNSAQDVSANGMYSVCKERGKISTLPEIPGVLVFMSGHTGVYIGNGEVIEARGHDYGVVRTKLSDRPWVSWGKCPWIEYGSKTVYFPAYKGKSSSIVDALESLDIEHSFAYRSKIAKVNNIMPYAGLAYQNIKMLNLLKSGELIKP